MPESDLLSGLIGALVGSTISVVVALFLYWHNGWQTARYALRSKLTVLFYQSNRDIRDDNVENPWRRSMEELWPLHLELYRWRWIGRGRASEAWITYKGTDYESVQNNPFSDRAPKEKKEFLERIEALLNTLR